MWIFILSSPTFDEHTKKTYKHPGSPWPPSLSPVGFTSFTIFQVNGLSSKWEVCPLVEWWLTSRVFRKSRTRLFQNIGPTLELLKEETHIPCKSSRPPKQGGLFGSADHPKNGSFLDFQGNLGGLFGCVGPRTKFVNYPKKIKLSERDRLKGEVSQPSIFGHVWVQTLKIGKFPQAWIFSDWPRCLEKVNQTYSPKC